MSRCDLCGRRSVGCLTEYGWLCLACIAEKRTAKRGALGPRPPERQYHQPGDVRTHTWRERRCAACGCSRGSDRARARCRPP